MTSSSSALVRRDSDARVIAALVRSRRMSRAALAEATGLSKPTASASVARLTAAGIVRESGHRTTGPGRAAPLLEFTGAPGVGMALAVTPHRVRGVLVDVHGQRLAVAETAHGQVAVSAALLEVAQRLAAAVPDAVRIITVDVADPVERHSGRAVHLPDAPFLVGELDAPAVLADLCDDVRVDNDVNWRARARASDGDCVAHLHLGEGLGAALVEDGVVVRGAHGFAGEIAHVVVSGPGRRAMAFTEVFAELGLRRLGGTAIDAERVRQVCADGGEAAGVLARAVGDVIAACVGLADPDCVVLEGEWGPAVVEGVRAVVGGAPRPVQVTAADSGSDAGLSGAAERVIEVLVARLVESATR